MVGDSIRRTTQLIKKSQRPILIVGNGARGSGYMDLKLPIITTRLGIDLIETKHPLFIGRPGLVSDRISHFAIQSADLIIALGARLDTGIVGYTFSDWGRNAKKIVVDIDKEELEKPGINIDLKINMDAKQFVDKLKKYQNKNDYKQWLLTIAKWKKKYPLPQTSSYRFIKKLSDLSKDDDVIVVDTSSAFHIVAQAWEIKKKQVYITTGGISTMGYWPAAIGANLASGRRTLCITGDGCFQMNIQELSTVVKNKLNVKIFLLNNNGYLLIRNTQKQHCEGRLIGEGPKTGLDFPNFKKVASAYGISYSTSIEKTLEAKGPVLCELKTPYWEKIEPRIISEKLADGSFINKAYEDLAPFLSEMPSLVKH